jgi:hypothetical protein
MSDTSATLHRAVTDLAWLIQTLPEAWREEFRKPLYVVVREANHLRRERDGWKARAALLGRLVRYQAETN